MHEYYEKKKQQQTTLKCVVRREKADKENIIKNGRDWLILGLEPSSRSRFSSHWRRTYKVTHWLVAVYICQVHHLGDACWKVISLNFTAVIEKDPCRLIYAGEVYLLHVFHDVTLL